MLPSCLFAVDLDMEQFNDRYNNLYVLRVQVMYHLVPFDNNISYFNGYSEQCIDVFCALFCCQVSDLSCWNISCLFKSVHVTIWKGARR